MKLLHGEGGKQRKLFWDDEVEERGKTSSEKLREIGQKLGGFELLYNEVEERGLGTWTRNATTSVEAAERREEQKSRGVVAGAGSHVRSAEEKTGERKNVELI